MWWIWLWNGEGRETKFREGGLWTLWRVLYDAFITEFTASLEIALCLFMKLLGRLSRICGVPVLTKSATRLTGVDASQLSTSVFDLRCLFPRRGPSFTSVGRRPPSAPPFLYWCYTAFGVQQTSIPRHRHSHRVIQRVP